MYRKAVNYLRGSVTVRVESEYPERVVNLLAVHAIPFWELRWLGENAFTVRIAWSSLPRLRAAAGEVPCTVQQMSRSGAPVLLLRLRRRYVLLAGMGLLLLLAVCGNFFIWEFRVTGNDTVPDETIIRALEEYGITIGTVSLRIDQEAMRNHVLLELPDVSWLVVNIKGCVAHVQVVERKRPPQTVREEELTNVVAQRSGLVTQVVQLDGKAQIRPGSTVTAGQLLISGVVDSSRSGVRFLHGMGEVWARTWYDLSVMVPLKEIQHTQQVAERTQVRLILGKRQINLFSKGSILGSDCGKIVHYGAVCLPGGFRLPVTVVKEQTVRYDAVVKERTLAEARAEGEAALLALLEQHMTGEGTVTDTRFSAARKGDYLLLTLHAECHEQIGQQVLLPQP